MPPHALRTCFCVVCALALVACAQTPMETRARPKRTGSLHFEGSYASVVFNLQNVAAACMRDDNRSHYELQFDEHEAGQSSTLTTTMTSLYGTQVLSVLDITSQGAGTDIEYFQSNFSWHIPRSAVLRRESNQSPVRDCSNFAKART